jgi:arylsulfatase A-like enzyme
MLAGLRKSYVAGRSGDLTFVPRPNWIVTSGATTHGTMHPYDTNVPMVFYGRAIRPGRYHTARTPLDIAPTLAAVAGIALPRAEGRPLTEILRP